MNEAVTLQQFWNTFKLSKINSWGKVLIIAGSIISSSYYLGSRVTNTMAQVNHNTEVGLTLTKILEIQQQKITAFDSLNAYSKERYYPITDGKILEAKLDNIADDIKIIKGLIYSNRK